MLRPSDIIVGLGVQIENFIHSSKYIFGFLLSSLGFLRAKLQLLPKRLGREWPLDTFLRSPDHTCSYVCPASGAAGAAGRIFVSQICNCCHSLRSWNATHGRYLQQCAAEVHYPIYPHQHLCKLMTGGAATVGTGGQHVSYGIKSLLLTFYLPKPQAQV